MMPLIVHKIHPHNLVFYFNIPGRMKPPNTQHHIVVCELNYIKNINQRLVPHGHTQSPNPLSTSDVVHVCYYHLKSLKIIHGYVPPRNQCCIYEVVIGPPSIGVVIL